MEDKEFILETLKRITPDTSWHGETNSDNKSIKNIDILEDMIYFLLDELFNCSTVPEGNKRNYSCKAIAKKKQEVIHCIKERWLDRSITIEEFLNSNVKLAIRCRTEEEAIKLITAVNKSDKERLYNSIKDTMIAACKYYGKDTCYSNDGGYGPISAFTDADYAIYQFEDIDLGDEQ